MMYDENKMLIDTVKKVIIIIQQVYFTYSDRNQKIQLWEEVLLKDGGNLFLQKNKGIF